MEWGILAALLLMTGRSQPSHEPQVVVLGPCCGPAEPAAEHEAGG